MVETIAAGEAAGSLAGGCACGEVRYRLIDAPIFVHCCHCTRCRRETGSAFAINGLIETNRVQVERGEVEPVDVPCDSGQGHTIFRCRRCQVALWSRYGRAGPKLTLLRVATLDQPEAFPPGAHIFTCSRLPWVELGDVIPAFDRFYDRDALWPPEAVARRAAALADG